MNTVKPNALQRDTLYFCLDYLLNHKSSKYREVVERKLCFNFDMSELMNCVLLDNKACDNLIKNYYLGSVLFKGDYVSGYRRDINNYIYKSLNDGKLLLTNDFIYKAIENIDFMITDYYTKQEKKLDILLDDPDTLIPNFTEICEQYKYVNKAKLIRSFINNKTIDARKLEDVYVELGKRPELLSEIVDNKDNNLAMKLLQHDRIDRVLEDKRFKNFHNVLELIKNDKRVNSHVNKDGLNVMRTLEESRVNSIKNL